MNKKSLQFVFATILTLATVQSATSAVLVDAIDVNYSPPHFREDYRPVVSENTDPPLKVLEIFADDPDFAQPTKPWFKFQLDNNADQTIKNSFRVVFNKDGDNGKGSATVYTKVKFDREQQREYHVPIVIADSGVPSLTSTNTLTVAIGNEALSVEDVHVLNVTDTTVEFLVRASKPVGKYTIRYYEKIDNHTVKTQSFENGGQLLLEGLIPSGLYTFQFQVVSSDGSTTSDWTKPQEVVLLPYTPEMVLRSLTDNTLQIEWSKKLNDFQRETIDGYSISYGYLQRDTYDTWKPLTCMINIELPKSCYGSSYTIADLSKNSYYEVQLRAHTKAGYGKPAITRIHVA